MNKANVILAAALLANAAGSAVAQSSQIKTAGSWELYGRANLAIDRLDDGKDYGKTKLRCGYCWTCWWEQDQWE